MDMDLIETIKEWVKLEGELNIKNPPRFVLENLYRNGKTVENLEMTLDLLTNLGKFEKYKDSGVYIPLKSIKKQTSFFGLLE